jgi:hypothetical protein
VEVRITNHSSKPITPRLQLRCTTTYRAHGSRRVSREQVCEIVLAVVPGMAKKQQAGQPPAAPALALALANMALAVRQTSLESPLIDVTYTLVLEAGTPGALNPDIGTVLHVEPAALHAALSGGGVPPMMAPQPMPLPTPVPMPASGQAPMPYPTTGYPGSASGYPGSAGPAGAYGGPAGAYPDGAPPPPQYGLPPPAYGDDPNVKPGIYRETSGGEDPSAPPASPPATAAPSTSGGYGYPSSYYPTGTVPSTGTSGL